MYWHEAVEALAEQIDAAMKARGISMTAFPARRHDEPGWMIGHVVDGRVLSDQPQPLIIACDDAALAEREVNAFLDGVVACTPTISARLRDHGLYFDHRIINGLWLRFVQHPDEHTVRCDTLIGNRPYPELRSETPSSK